MDLLYYFSFAFNIIWHIFALVLIVLTYRIVSKEFRKFYPHILVGVVKDIEKNYSTTYSSGEKHFIYAVYAFIFLPITLWWLLAWALYKGVSLLISKLKKANTNVEDNTSTIKEEVVEEDTNDTTPIIDEIESVVEDESTSI